MATLTMLALSVPASASSGPFSQKRAYPLYGNGSLGDCPIAAVAGLTAHEFGLSSVTNAEAIRAFSWTVATGTDELSYMESRGFNGYRISGYTPVTTRAQMIAGADAGGVEADIAITGRQVDHAVAVIHANAKAVWWIDYGYVERTPWPVWLDFYKGSAWDANAVTWALRDVKDAVVVFEGSYETDSMTSQVEPVGAVAPLESLGMVNAGYTFDGWSTNEGGTGKLYANGAAFRFTQGAVLYAVWTYGG